MDGKYQAELVLDSASPIHALVTNYNFSPLLRWLETHSQVLKRKTPRLLVITSVLLAPDYATDLFDSRLTMKEDDRGRASQAYKNALRILLESLDRFASSCKNWSILEIPDETTYDELRQLATSLDYSPTIEFGTFLGTRFDGAEIAGTRYLMCCRARTIHRHHPGSLTRPTGSARRGFCYDGDHCRHFSHYAHETDLPSLTWATRNLRKMIVSAVRRSHDANTREKWSRGFVAQSNPHDQEMGKIYRQLDKANTQSGAFNHLRPGVVSGHDPKKVVFGAKRGHVDKLLLSAVFSNAGLPVAFSVACQVHRLVLAGTVLLQHLW
jgi:hypothetical protein